MLTSFILQSDSVLFLSRAQALSRLFVSQLPFLDYILYEPFTAMYVRVTLICVYSSQCDLCLWKLLFSEFFPLVCGDSCLVSFVIVVIF